MNKQIKRNRQNKDYDAFLNGEYIGSFDTYHAAEVELDRIAFDLLSH